MRAAAVSGNQRSVHQWKLMVPHATSGIGRSHMVTIEGVAHCKAQPTGHSEARGTANRKHSGARAAAPHNTARSLVCREDRPTSGPSKAGTICR